MPAATRSSTSPLRRPPSSIDREAARRRTGSPTSRTPALVARIVDREAVRARRRTAAALDDARCTGLPRAPGLPHRPLPRQGDGPEHPRASASPTGSSSRSGTATTSTTCRSPSPSRSASRAAAASTRRPARCATSCRTTCSSCSSFVAMEPPARFDAEAVRDESAKVLRSMRPLERRDDVGARPVRRAATRAASRCRATATRRASRRARVIETYVAARRPARQLALGRRALLPAHRQAPAQARDARSRSSSSACRTCRSAYAAAEQLEPNVLVLRIQPDEGIALRFGAKVPATRTADPHRHDGLRLRRRVRRRPAEAYETLLLDALRGDATNFTRTDAVWSSRWRIVDPLMESWAQSGGAPHLYAAGTWGPDAADDMLARDGRRWRRRVSASRSRSRVRARHAATASTSGPGAPPCARACSIWSRSATTSPRCGVAGGGRGAAVQPPVAGALALVRKGDGPVEFKVQVFAHNTGGDERAVSASPCSLVSGGGGAPLPSLIAGLLLPDLPVVLLWRARPRIQERAAGRLLAASRRASSWTPPASRARSRHCTC